LTATAKFSPSPPDALKALTPISFPSSLIKGPPELPGLIGVCVWMTSATNFVGPGPHSKAGRIWLTSPLV